ncbi:MAG: hypothetical protein U9Q06_03000 [Nanoarchaeota archaeon]|nr:hypothetical protein [Nanoarchaeota archaeon]
MKTKFVLAFLVAILTTVLVANIASAALEISTPSVKVNDLDANYNVSVIAGETYPVTVKFTAEEDASDVEVSAWIQGERSDRVDREFYDLVKGSQYNARLSVVIPNDIDPEEELTLYVRVESDSGNKEMEYTLYAQRLSDNLEFLLVDMDREANAGSTLAVNVVLKNMGRQEAEDTLVTVNIPELGVSRAAYFEDLYPEDSCSDSNCDRSDSRERMIFLTIPESARAGIYNVEITAESDETESTVSKTLRVTDSYIRGILLTNPSSRNFAVGQEVVYDLVLVNNGDEIAVYHLAPQSSDALSISMSESFATVPAGTSKNVQVYVRANRQGTFNFAVDVTSEGFSELAQYSATVEGRSIVGGNSVVALTIVLAIVFIVLVVILAVLLTRKTEKTEEFGESYY